MLYPAAQVSSACKGRSVASLTQGRTDDFLFFESDGSENLVENKCHIVHLTWRKETKPDWPWVVSFSEYADFVQNWRKVFD